MRKLPIALSLGLVLAAMGAAPSVLAQDAAALSRGDSHFVKAASAAGDTEVAASKLADTHASSSNVKEFATKMVTDHTAANEKLSGIASKIGATPSTEPMPKQQASVDKLAKLNGAAFDKAYSAMMVKDHAKVVALFTKESSSGTQADLKQFASDTLPTLKEHQAMAKKLPAGM